MENYKYEVGYNKGLQQGTKDFFVGYYVIDKDCPSEQSMTEELNRRIMAEVRSLNPDKFWNKYRKLDKMEDTTPSPANDEKFRYFVEFNSLSCPYMTYGKLTTIFEITINKMLKDYNRLTKGEWQFLD
jgi:hypothetical protein